MGLSIFSMICIMHYLVAYTYGSLIMNYINEIYVFGQGVKTVQKLSGTTSHDQLLIQTSNSFAGLLLFVVRFFLFMVGFVKDSEFHSFFAKGCVLLHVSMALWRVYFERRI
ncbi:hypothetical protein UlMin_036405 [Ulmus minor]